MTPPRPIMELGWAFHRFLHAATGGRFSTAPPSAEGRVGTLFLASIGRKTGRVRRTALFFIQDGPSFVVVASNGGAIADPAWWLNLRARPEATVELERHHIEVRAREATPAEAERLWPCLEAGYPAYARYRAARTSPIPVVILEPRESTPMPPAPGSD